MLFLDQFDLLLVFAATIVQWRAHTVCVVGLFLLQDVHFEQSSIRGSIGRRQGGIYAVLADTGSFWSAANRAGVMGGWRESRSDGRHDKLRRNREGSTEGSKMRERRSVM
jgi:hypothetical protein